MAEDQGQDAASEDGLSKEFDEIVAQADEQPDDGAVTITVRNDDAVSKDTTAEPSEDTAKSATPAATPAAKPVTVEKAHSSGGLMVLQWLSYAFWGWFSVAMGWLSAVTIAYFVVGNTDDVAAALAYPLASVIVMFALAATADAFYARREPVQKQGGPNVIMLIHVVLFVLLAVAAAITGLFSLISMMLTTDPSAGTEGQVVAAWTSLVLIIAFGSSAMRVLFGGKQKKLRLTHWIVMCALAVGVIAASIMGPVVGAQSTKEDRVLEQGLPALVQAVGEYVSENDKLPEKLSDANDASTYATAASTSIVSRGLARYTANVKEPTTASWYTGIYSAPKTYYYQLCVTYKQAKKASGTYYGEDTAASNGKYTSYLSISSHKQGEVCYDLEATSGYGGIVYPADDVKGTSSSSAGAAEAN